MHFGLTEEQLLLQETVRGFAAAECPAPRLREIFDAGAGHDPALWKGLAEVGVTGLTVPESLGGAGLGLPDLASGERIATAAFAESGGAWDPEAWQLADDGNLLSGAKRHVPHGALADL